MSNTDSQPIASWDIDGVLYLPQPYPTPRPNFRDVIITGRSFEEMGETRYYLDSKEIYNTVIFNPKQFHEKTRVTSGEHKANTILNLVEQGYNIVVHYEDDPIQAEIIRKLTGIVVIELQHNLVEKENVRQGDR